MGKRRIIIPGTVFGRLTVVEEGSKMYGRRSFVCSCSCGSKPDKQYTMSNLHVGQTTSCGCLHREVLIALSTTHGHTAGCNTKVYRTWIGIRERCGPNAKGTSRKYYYEKGIRVCDRWENSFMDFLSDMGEPPTPGHSIDRIDPAKDYEPSNCRWVTRLEQGRNTSRTVRVMYEGEMLPLHVIAEKTGVPKKLFYPRLRRGWSIERAVAEPKHKTAEHMRRARQLSPNMTT